MNMTGITHRVLTDEARRPALAAWAESEGLNADDIVAGDMYIRATPDGPALVGTMLSRNPRGEHYLAADGFATHAFDVPVETMPPVTVRL